jgi:cysteine dioxygenase
MEMLNFLTPEQEASMNCMDGLPDHYSPVSISSLTALKADSPAKQPCACITFTCLICALKKVFKDAEIKDNWPARKSRIEEILKNTYLNEKEIQKYVFVDTSIPYTRNLVFTDNENFTLILMCWNPKKESKVHDHPCDGCFVKTLRGGVRESRYHMEEVVNENGTTERVLKFDWEYCTSVNEVTYMDNYLGYHKIGCVSPDEPAMSLHLYTPPFKSCKVSGISFFFLLFFDIELCRFGLIRPTLIK